MSSNVEDGKQHEKCFKYETNSGKERKRVPYGRKRGNQVPNVTDEEALLNDV
jgi:hypothetical protein